MCANCSGLKPGDNFETDTQFTQYVTRIHLSGPQPAGPTPEELAYQEVPNWDTALSTTFQYLYYTVSGESEEHKRLRVGYEATIFEISVSITVSPDAQNTLKNVTE